jgi:transporter family-2 protein
MLAIRLSLWSIAAGALIPIMAVLNARLGLALGEPLHASTILFMVGLVTCVIIAILLTGSIPDFSRLTAVQPIELAGGLIVGFYVISATLLAPRFGVGNFILFAVAAQVVSAALIDHFGLFGAVIRPVNPVRLGGISLLLAGLAITRINRQATATREQFDKVVSGLQSGQDVVFEVVNPKRPADGINFVGGTLP